MNISRKTFCDAMQQIQEPEKTDHEICESLGKIADIFSFNKNNLYLKALIHVLKEAAGDNEDYIS